MAVGEVNATVNVYRFSIFMRIRLQNIQTAFYVRDPAGTTTTAAAAVTHLRTWIESQFQQCLSNDVAIMKVQAEELTTGDFNQHTYGNGLPGAYITPMISSMLSTCIRISSTARRRWQIGRMFWPVSSAPVADALQTESRTRLVNATNALLTRTTGITPPPLVQLCVVSGLRPSVLVPGTQVRYFTDANTLTILDTVTSLRSRRSGVGS